MKKQRKKKEKEKTKEKAREKAKKKKSNLVKLNLIGQKHASYAKEHCSLKVGIIHTFPKHHTL